MTNETEAAMTHDHPNPDLPQRWRLRSAGCGRQVLAAVPGVRYPDRYSGEKMTVIGRLLPLAPSRSLLPWAEKDLRFPTCDQLVQKDVNYCPYDGRPLPPLERHGATDPGEPIGSS
jgi:hypothetical protein